MKRESSAGNGPRISGAILAGGGASRLDGIVKGALIDPSSGLSIAETLIAEFSRAGIGDVVISVNEPEPYRHCAREIVRDLRGGMGPLGGIEAVLAHYARRADAVLFLPCDTPRVTAIEITALKKAYRNGNAPIVFAESDDSDGHYLCAVVDVDLKEKISAAIDEERLTVGRLWPEIGAIGVRFPDGTPFVNINTEADLKEWRRAD